MNFDLRKSTSLTPENDSKIKIIFMGSGPFAVPILEEIAQKNDEFNLILTITKPNSDKPSLNDKFQNKIKEISILNNSRVSQPHKIDEQIIKLIKNLKPDLIVVASYGKILKKEILDIPKYGCINVHASLLPELRGASPIQNAIILGKKETGITIMKMDEGLDTGDIISQIKVPIDDEDTTDTLLPKLAKNGAVLLTKTIKPYISGKIKLIPQDNSKATLCQIIEREDGHINWTKNAAEIYNLYRALVTWPGIFSFWNKDTGGAIRIKFKKIAKISLSNEILKKYPPATVFSLDKRMFVRANDNAIEIIRLQREGKKEMSADNFINGNSDIIGSKLN